MLNPQKKLHRLLGSLLLQVPPLQRRWLDCYQHFLPILQDIFTDNAAARLLLMRCLENIENGNIERAQQIIEKLRPLFILNATPPYHVLWYVLHALHQSKSGHFSKMNANLRAANKLEHRYHIAHVLYAEDVCTRLHIYDEAEVHFSKAIDCIYAFPPVSDRGREVIRLIYCRLASVRTMMHRFDAAQEALRIAESMQASPEDLACSQALLHAARGLSAPARSCLDQLRATSPERAEDLTTIIDLILAQRHPHFTPLPVGSPEGIAAFWQKFLEQEEAMMQLLRDKRRMDARALIADPINAMDPYEDDYFSFDVVLENNEFAFYLGANFSRTYTPFIAAIAAACPEEIRSRWKVVCKP